MLYVDVPVRSGFIEDHQASHYTRYKKQYQSLSTKIMSPILQTKTPLLIHPDKDALVAEFAGKPLASLRTPAFVVDRAVFAKNCRKMHENAKEWGATFRAHLKTHKVGE